VSNPPWMPLHIGDYRKDTAHLGASEHGAYLLLIMHYWQTGALPDDDRQLARIACMSEREWRKARPLVQGFFHDGWKHKRIDKELAHAADVISKRRAAAQQRYSKSDANADAKAHANAGPKGGDTRVPPPTDNLSVANATGADAPPDPAIAERELFARGKEVLGPKAGATITQLKAAKGGNVALARAAIEQASQAENPREYVHAIIAKPNGGSRHVVRPSLTDVAHDLANEWREREQRELLTVGSG
jgi:uncharacterized protein YdaU (DUF1376 family)